MDIGVSIDCVLCGDMCCVRRCASASTSELLPSDDSNAHMTGKPEGTGARLSALSVLGGRRM